MKIKQIFEKDFPNNKNTIFTYQSDFYYDIQVNKKPNNEGWIFEWFKKPFSKPFTKKEEGKLFAPYKENGEFYVVQNDEEIEIGYLVLCKQEWNNVLRIWDIDLSEGYRRQGIGKKMIALAEARAREFKCRALVLECQSSNYPAIQFYICCGFSLTGFDLISYSNQDIERHNIRLEMSKILEYVN